MLDNNIFFNEVEEKWRRGVSEEESKEIIRCIEDRIKSNNTSDDDKSRGLMGIVK